MTMAWVLNTAPVNAYMARVQGIPFGSRAVFVTTRVSVTLHIMC